MNTEIIRIDLGGVNSYLLKVEDGFILVDTGGHIILDKVFSNRLEILERELENAGCKPRNLKLVILTHGDNDHVANSSYIREKYQVKIALHRKDLNLVENPTIEKVMESFKYKSIIYKLIFQLMKNQIKKISKKVLENYKSFKPDIIIDDEFLLSQYGFNGKALHMPGHTEGSIVILSENGDLIVGDIFTNIKNPDTSPNAVDFKLLKISIDKLKTMNVKTVFPGHGVPFSMSELNK